MCSVVKTTGHFAFGRGGSYESASSAFEVAGHQGGGAGSSSNFEQAALGASLLMCFQLQKGSPVMRATSQDDNISISGSSACSGSGNEGGGSGRRQSSSKKCEHESGCLTQPSFGFPGDTKKFCSSHRLEGMVVLHSRRLCEEADCNIRPCFGIVGQPPRFCSAHKEPDMVLLGAKKCSFSGCNTVPVFGLERNSKERFCSKHRTADMVDLLNRRCEAPEGCTTQPHFGFPNDKARFCVQHKTEGMVKVGGRGNRRKKSLEKPEPEAPVSTAPTKLWPNSSPAAQRQPAVKDEMKDEMRVLPTPERWAGPRFNYSDSNDINALPLPTVHPMVWQHRPPSSPQSQQLQQHHMSHQSSDPRFDAERGYREAFPPSYMMVPHFMQRPPMYAFMPPPSMSMAPLRHTSTPLPPFQYRSHMLPPPPVAAPRMEAHTSLPTNSLPSIQRVPKRRWYSEGAISSMTEQQQQSSTSPTNEQEGRRQRMRVNSEDSTHASKPEPVELQPRRSTPSPPLKGSPRSD